MNKHAPRRLYRWWSSCNLLVKQITSKLCQTTMQYLTILTINGVKPHHLHFESSNTILKINNALKDIFKLGVGCGGCWSPGHPGSESIYTVTKTKCCCMVPSVYDLELIMSALFVLDILYFAVLIFMNIIENTVWSEMQLRNNFILVVNPHRVAVSPVENSLDTKT